MATSPRCVHLSIQVHSGPCCGYFTCPGPPSISVTKTSSLPASNEIPNEMAILRRVIRRIRGRERLREEAEPLLEESTSSKSSASSVKSTPIDTPDTHDNIWLGHEQHQHDLFNAVPASPVSPLSDTNKPLPTVPRAPITQPNFIPANALNGVERPYTEDSNGRLSILTSPKPANKPCPPLPSPPRHQSVRRPSSILIKTSNNNSDHELIFRALDSMRLDLTTSHGPHPNAAELARFPLEPASVPLPPSPAPTPTSPVHLDQADRARHAGLEQLQYRRSNNAFSPPPQLPPLDLPRSSLIDEVAEREWVMRQVQQQAPNTSPRRQSHSTNNGGIFNGFHPQPNGATSSPPLPPQTPTVQLAEDVAERQWMERQVEQMNANLPIPNRRSSLGTRILKRK
ncbi:uncharacterized protein BKA78DRAFT_341297 [Phyllosticta capitalensis]|uniref:uncharacterized protein n=1 Tax=Phyllosticta capitalensis TaxID=121624 RepID=UPI00312DF20A